MALNHLITTGASPVYAVEGGGEGCSFNLAFLGLTCVVGPYTPFNGLMGLNEMMSHYMAPRTLCTREMRNGQTFSLSPVATPVYVASAIGATLPITDIVISVRLYCSTS